MNQVKFRSGSGIPTSMNNNDLYFSKLGRLYYGNKLIGENLDKLTLGSNITSTPQYSIVGGTNDKSIITNLLGSLASTEISLNIPVSTAQCSISYGAGTVVNSIGSSAIGVWNTSGCKGYYWKELTNTAGATTSTFALSATQPSLLSWEPVSSVDWQIGDTICVIDEAHFPMCATITAKGTKEIGNALTGKKTTVTITTTKLPFNGEESLLLTTPQNKSICAFYQKTEVDILNKLTNKRWCPRNGAVEFGWGTISLGAENLNTGAAGLTIGFNNWQASNFGIVAGRENISGYGNITSGHLNKNLGDNGIMVGKENTAQHKALTNIICGRNNTAYTGSDGAIIGGSTNENWTYNSLIVGARNKATGTDKGDHIIGGSDNELSNVWNSLAVGTGNYVNSSNAIVCGSYAASSYAKIIVGGGSKDDTGAISRKNVFTVDDKGNVTSVSSINGQSVCATQLIKSEKEICLEYPTSVNGEPHRTNPLRMYTTDALYSPEGAAILVLGPNKLESQHNTLTIGTSIINNSDNAIACGNNNKLTGQNNFITGKDNTNSGPRAYVGGQENSNLGQNAIVSGYRCFNESNGTVVVGNQNSSLYSNSFVAGYNNISNGYNNIIAGHKNVIGYNMGRYILDSNNQPVPTDYGYIWDDGAHTGCAVFGEGNHTTNSYQTIVGKYSVSSYDALFTVGDGTSSAHKNAFTIKGNSDKENSLLLGNNTFEVDFNGDIYSYENQFRPRLSQKMNHAIKVLSQIDPEDEIVAVLGDPGVQLCLQTNSANTAGRAGLMITHLGDPDDSNSIRLPNGNYTCYWQINVEKLKSKGYSLCYNENEGEYYIAFGSDSSALSTARSNNEHLIAKNKLSVTVANNAFYFVYIELNNLTNYDHGVKKAKEAAALIDSFILVKEGTLSSNTGINTNQPPITI